MRIAFIHDWLVGMRGGERCLESLLALFPDSDVYTLIADKQKLSPALQKANIIQAGIHVFPGSTSWFRHALPLFPLLSKMLGKRLAREHAKQPYDLVISVSHCLAKNVPMPLGVAHLCYCLTPVRYCWDQFDRYFAGRAIEPIARVVARSLRRWDTRGAKRVTEFIAISDYIAERISRYYQRQAQVIYPPVGDSWFEGESASAFAQQGQPRFEDGFLVVNALVPYKNTEVIIAAFNELGWPLTIVGRGSERERLEKLAGPTVRFLDGLTDAQLRDVYRASNALIFAAEEDFGITPVESQAVGRPVIAYGRGGALETVVEYGDKPTGIFYHELNPEALIAALRKFRHRQTEFTVDNCRQQAARFTEAIFSDTFLKAVQNFALERSGGEHRKDNVVTGEGAEVAIRSKSSSVDGPAVIRAAPQAAVNE